MTENDNIAEIPKEPEAPASQSVVGIRFRSCGKIYTFDVNDVDAPQGTRVVVDSEMGLSIGSVVTPKQIKKKSKEPLKKVLRVATDEDFETVKNNRGLENEARLFCAEKAKALNLSMKIVSTETTMDKKRLIFYFSADGRIDFRELVRDLASKFKTRIEMRQIGVRDEVKILGGFGCCGRQSCCSLFLTSFAPITIRMAKEQDLSINQSKLSGICGRLMCCLGYEHRDSTVDERKSRARKAAAAAADKALAESALQPADSAAVPGRESEKRRRPLRRKEPAEEKKTSSAPSQDKAKDKAAKDKRRFRGDRRRKKKPGAENIPAENKPEKKPQPAAAEKTGQAEPKKGKPSNRRRKFWKKKKE
jgi:cell fate regulator YaaT (PSP1 superfamily)